MDLAVVIQEHVRSDWFGIRTFEVEAAAIAELVRPSDRFRLVLAGDDQREQPLPLDRDLTAAAHRAWTCAPIYDALARTLMRPTDPVRPHVVVLITETEGSGNVLTTEAIAEIARRSNARLYVAAVDRPVGGTIWARSVSWQVCPRGEVDWSEPRRARLRQIDGTPSAFQQWHELRVDGSRRLIEIAELTGGGEVRPTILTNSYAGPIAKALDEVRAGYVLRYTPKGVPETGWHAIAVTIRRQGRYDVRVRPGYQR